MSDKDNSTMMAYLFIAMAHGADHDFAEEEKVVTLEKVELWDRTLDKASTKALVKRVAGVYAEDRRAGTVRKRLERYIAQLGDTLSENKLKQALSDMVDLAKADGVIVEGEWKLLDAIKRAWQVEASA
ncbi:MAG: TerB family tellurite resistance protein [Planctomycetota bacterium]|jgi:hypothetical protein